MTWMHGPTKSRRKSRARCGTTPPINSCSGHTSIASRNEAGTQGGKPNPEELVNRAGSQQTWRSKP
ncbi:hypothetical protein N9L68_04605 [bacterium]|nr:hypothetical protein [bacterium]